MKASRLITVALAALLLGTILTTVPPTAAHRDAAPRQSSAAPLDTATTIPTTTPSGCDGWNVVAPYPIPISYNAVTSLGGYIYSFGGYTTGGAATTAAYKFDGNTWTAIASLPLSLTRGSAVSDGTSTYIIGSHTSDNNPNLFYRYDPASDSYTALVSPITITNLQTLLYLNGDIYRIGSAPQGQNDLVITDYYVSSTGQWRTASNYPAPAYEVVAIALEGNIYAAGDDPVSKIYRYDTNTNLWDDIAVADLQVNPQGATSGVLNGAWLLVGGYPGQTHPAYSWDAATNSWQQLADLPLPPGGTTGATLGNAFYTIGGWTTASPLNNVERYTNTCPSPTPTPTVTGTPPTAIPSPTSPCEAWQEQPAYPYFTALNTVVSLNGGLYGFGGETNQAGTGFNPHSYKFDGSYWAQIADPPALFADASAVTDGTYIYLLNGVTQSTEESNTFYRYDPAADSYTVLASAPISTDLQSAAYFNGSIYLIGGIASNGRYTSTVQVYTISTNIWGFAASYPQLVGWRSRSCAEWLYLRCGRWSRYG